MSLCDYLSLGGLVFSAHSIGVALFPTLSHGSLYRSWVVLPPSDWINLLNASHLYPDIQIGFFFSFFFPSVLVLSRHGPRGLLLFNRISLLNASSLCAQRSSLSFCCELCSFLLGFLACDGVGHVHPHHLLYSAILVNIFFYHQ